MFTLSDAKKALEGRTEFAVKEYHERLVTINYLVMLPDSFDGIRENFRGVTFDKKTEEIISLPFQKFYCINQREHTQYSLIKDLKATVYEKLDGSLIHFYREPTSNPKEYWRIVASTRMSCETPQAQEAHLLALRIGVMPLIEEVVDSGFTPCFEYVAPHNQIVIEYPKPRLVYLHSRNRKTGGYFFDERFPDKAQRYDVQFSEIFESLQDKKDFEGYVCVLENGLWVKAKCNWYQEKHHAVDSLMKPAYKLYEIALDNQMDDLLAACPDKFRPRLQEIANETAAAYSKLRFDIGKAAEEGWEAAGREDRKAFVMYAQKHHKDMFSALMSAYDGREADAWIKTKLMERFRERYPKKLFAELQETES